MKRVLIILFALSIGSSALGQTGRRTPALAQSRGNPNSAGADRLETYGFDSKFLRRKVYFNVLVPPSYRSVNSRDRVYPVLYLLHGLTGRFDNWITRTALREYTRSREIIVVMSEAGDSWYTDSLTVPDDKFESYLIKEFIPEIDKRFRTIADRRGRLVAGLSMGGYGAIKFGLKYPEMFKLVGSFSGALDGPLRGQTHANYRPSIMAVFGPEDSAFRKENDVFEMLGKMPPDGLKRLPFFYVSCGTEDIVNFTYNRDFAALLVEKKVPHEYRQFPGAHTWIVWDQEIDEFLRIAEKRG